MRKAVEVALAIPATPGAAAEAAAVSDFTLSLPLKLWTEISILNIFPKLGLTFCQKWTSNACEDLSIKN